MKTLTPDWQQFFSDLGEGMAVFGLFELGERGVEPVLLIHAQPDLRLPQPPGVKFTLAGIIEAGVYVWHLGIELRAYDPNNQLDMLQISLVDDSLRSLRVEMIVKNTPRPRPRPMYFETFLNPKNGEDRSILQKLAEVDQLSILLVQAGQMVWSKRFPWKSPCSEQVRGVLAKTKDTPPVSVEAWEKARAGVMQKYMFPGIEVM